MWRGRSTPQLTEKRSRVHVVPSPAYSLSSRSMMRAIVLLCCTFFVVIDIEVVTSMSIERLGIDRFNDIRSDKQQQFAIHDNDKSDLMVEDIEVEAVPANGETDMYVLLPARGSTSDRDSVNRNTIDSDDTESIGGDMLMMESNDAPIIKVAQLPSIVVKDDKIIVEKSHDTIKLDADKSDSSEEMDDEPIKQVFKNDKDIEDMAIENNAKEDTDSEEGGEAKDDSDNERESVVEILADVADEVEKEIEAELLDDESEDTVTDEVKETNDEEKAKWEATVEKLEVKGSEKNKDDSDIELDEAAAVMEEILPEEIVEVMAVADGSDSSSEENGELEKKKEGNINEENIIVSAQKVQTEKETEKEEVYNKEKENEGDNPKEINEDLEQDANHLVSKKTTEKPNMDEMDKLEELKEELIKDVPNVQEENNDKQKEPINTLNMELEDNLSSQTEQLSNGITKVVEKEEQDEGSTEQPSLETVEIVQSDTSNDKKKDNEVLVETEMVNIENDHGNEEQLMMESSDREPLPVNNQETENDVNKDGEIDTSELNSVTTKPLDPINSGEYSEQVDEINPTVLESIKQNENEHKNEAATEKVLEVLNAPEENAIMPQNSKLALEDSASAAETATILTTILQTPTTQQEEQQHNEMPVIQQQVQQVEHQLHDELPVVTEQVQEEVKKDAQPTVEQQKENEQPVVQVQEENGPPVEAYKEDVPHNEMQTADSEEPNVQIVSDALETTQITIESSTQKPQIVATATEDSVLNYVNATNAVQALVSATAQQLQNATESDGQGSFSSQLRRYDGAQVWRIVVQNDRDRRLADELQTKYDAQLWKEVKQEVDYLLKPQVLAAAEKHIRSANLSRIVLIDNLQQVIEVENPPLDELADADNEKGHRLTWQAYHRLADIHEYFDYLAKTYPEICAVETIGYSVQKRPLKVLKISNGNAGNPGVWIDGGMHAREWVSPASVTYVANQLAEGWEGLPSYMQNINWYIHAVANPDGYEYTHTTDRLWRKNLRSHGRQCPGVDLNRNFGFKWGGKGTSANPCSQIYRGSKAFSEPETFYISKFISSFPRDTFQAYLSFHSYGQYILYPWGYDYLVTSDRADLDGVARAAATTITRSTGAKYTVGSSSITLYPAAGGSDDWAKGIANIKYTYTIEMGDSGRYGFILPANQIETNGRDAYTFVQTVARAISHDARKRAMKLKWK